MEKCYICESGAVDILTTISDFSIYRCKRCKLRWTGAVVQEKLTHFYQSDYFNSETKVGYEDYLANEKLHRKNARHLLSLVDKVKSLSNNKILDVGCAFGFLLDEAVKLKKCDAYGVEISRYACAYAKNKLQLNILNSELSSKQFSAGFFGVVFMVGTIEHLIYPRDTISIVNEILKAGGLLVVITIDTSGLFPFYSFKPPEHIFYFNHNNIRLFFKKLGFEIMVRKTYFAYYYFHDLFHRLAEFLSMPFFNTLSSLIKKQAPNFYIKIPTNEMVLILKKIDNL